MASPSSAIWSKRWGGLTALAPHPGREEAEKFSKLDFAQRHMLKLMLLERWGTFPAAGDRHIAEFLSFALTPESEWGAAYNIALTPIARREKNAAEDVANVDAWLAGSKPAPDMAIGGAPLPDDRGHVDGCALRGPGQHPQYGPGPGPARRRRRRVDVRHRRGRHPRP